jgi:hypothetical protein
MDNNETNEAVSDIISNYMRGLGQKTSDEKSASGKINMARARAFITPEGRAANSQAAKARWAKMTPEQKQERLDKLAAGRLKKLNELSLEYPLTL